MTQLIVIIMEKTHPVWHNPESDMCCFSRDNIVHFQTEQYPTV